MNYDKLLISILTNNKGIIRSKYDRLCNYPNILSYISNRYTDSENLYESIRRMSLKIDIKPLCPICGNPTKYIGKKSRMFSKYCSNSCRAKERSNIDRWVEGQKKYNLAHYGVEYVWQREDVKEKRKKKLIDKYGTDNLTKVDEISDKKRQTSISHYSVEHPRDLQYIVSEETLIKEFEYYKTANPSKINSISRKNEIVKFFQQDTFFRKEKELFKDPIIQSKLIENRKKYLNKDIISDNELLLGFKKSAIYYGYSHFNPLWFKWFITKYNVKTCYDPCGGWGHRLLGALNLDTYIYNDLSYSTCVGVQNIVDYFNIANAIIYNEDASSFEPLEKYEAIFTCPPYYNIEHYECGDFSSLDEYYYLLDSILFNFENNENVRVMGIVLREDLLSPSLLESYNEKYEVNITKSTHLINIKKNKEYLYIYLK